MAEAPVAKKPDAKRTDRRTRIAQGPAPLPPPVTPPAPVAKPAEAKAKASIKKTQMIMGAPPLPPAVTGKTHVQSGPPKVPAAAKASPAAPGVDRVPDDFALPSDQQTVVGPAPVPPVPKPVVDSSSAEVMERMMHGGGIFDDLFEDEGVTELHQASEPIAIESFESEPMPMHKPPPRPVSGPAPRATGKRDTMSTAELRHGPTNPPMSELASADTQVDLDPSLGSDDASDRAFGLAPEKAERRPTAVQIPRSRENRVGTAMQGMEGLATPSADAPKIRLIPGRKIPGTRYEIRRWLGEGGMGVVYEVIHTDIERRSALKILRFDLSHQPQMAQVFRDEARAASRLGSPYIVEVYDFGELPDGRLFFAMELLEGQDLVPADEQASMEPSRLIGILRQVCKGLAKAHEAGVVHRDVKPENIILIQTEGGRTDAVKLVDFGISAMLAAGEKRAGIAGTPHYMAPEQILGEDFDGRLDIYALGCTAYELMVGTPPFDAEEVDALLKLQVKAQPRPPREARPELEIPAELETVVMRCLAKRPEDRYENMAELEAALCEAQIAAGITTLWDDLPVPALPDHERYQRIVSRMPSRHAPAPTKRSWLWPVVAGASTLAAASLAAYLAFGRQPTAEERDLVEELTIEAREAASKTAWVYPPPHVESKTTALRKIVELERVEGKAESMADDRAVELRHEFATTLVDHGDKLWDEARTIAQQYYVWALIFEDNPHAFERADVDEITLGRFRKHAEEGEFSKAEILVASLAMMKVVDNPEQKEAMSAAIQEGMRESDDMSPLMLAQLARSAKSAGMELDEPKRGSGTRGAGEGRPAARPVERRDPEPPPPDDVVIDDEGDSDGEDVDPAAAASRKKRRRQVELGLDEGKVRSNPARSKELTLKADEKRKQGLRGEAKDLYSQAIAANPKNGAAHLGLAQVHFDLASYDKARKSALQAVKYAPRDGRAYKVLGDA
ncbi:MAG: protein kinase, partial [Myxococcales bacterium]|nr:protein kinase [Myxococcales bacterium]